MRRKFRWIEAIDKINNCHSRGSNRESSVFKNQKTLDSRLSTHRFAEAKGLRE